MQEKYSEQNLSSIRDNRFRGTVGDFLNDNIVDGSKLSIVSAYFTIYAYHYFKDKLDCIENLRFLFGEPTFLKTFDSQNSNLRNFKIEDENIVIPIENRLLQKKVAFECANWISTKVAIRSMVKPNFLHGKLYHLRQPGGVEKAITGSSNFTVNGLGAGTRPNIELNIVVDSDRDRNELLKWFDEIWNDSSGLVEDVKYQVLKYLEQLYFENGPEFIYFKTLFHIFQDYLGEQQRGGMLTEKTGFFESEIWNSLYDFQKDGVKGAINKILKHNGCIIADSVGLGKTYEALAVIKYFELINFRVLLLCPKKLVGNWTVYQAFQNHELNPFLKDKFGFTVLYHTDMGRESGFSDANNIDLQSFNWSAFDLVVIDESHNFRGNPIEKTKSDGSTKMNRSKWLMEKILKSGVKTKVLLLSATPVNNNLRDLRNQISLITSGNDNALFETCQIKDIAQTLKVAQRQFTLWADTRRNTNRNIKQLLERLDSGFFKLLDEMTIARSRKHIIGYYDIKAIGSFPTRLKPESIYPKIDLKDRFFTYDELNKRILQYKLSVFNPSAYVIDERVSKYEEVSERGVKAFRQSERESSLIGMMKVNYLKRLESSIESFEISLDRTIKKIEVLLQKIENYKNSTLESSLIDFEYLNPEDEELVLEGENEDSWQVGKKLKFDLADLKLDDWISDLQSDKEALIDLYNTAASVTPDRDAKIAEVKKCILRKVTNPINTNNKKVLIFTAFADTAEYLYYNLKPWCREELNMNIALVAGSKSHTTFGRNDYSNILTNFSPISKNRCRVTSMPQDNEIDVLIATDCISEGQNLQDCDYLINFDIHWNPVKIIQRFGRIDRLGSKNDKIQLVNFWPTKDLDNYINLKVRVEARMALVDITATGEENILNVDQIEDLVTEDLKYRNRQLHRLKDEVLDLEELNENLSLTDFTLEDFRIELLKFLENNRQRLEESPLGLYAIVPAPSKDDEELFPFSQSLTEIIKPGVVFCLKQIGNTEGNEEVNPLNPYFLIYIRDDGTVRYNYTQSKQVLEILRNLCQGKRTAYHELCDVFNAETSQGKNMNKYSELIKKSVYEITRMFKRRVASKLTSDRGSLLIPKEKQVNNLNDFELITWLVIK